MSRGSRHLQGPNIGLNFNAPSSLGHTSCEPVGFTRALEYSRHGVQTGVGRGDVLSTGGSVGEILGLGGKGERQFDYKSSLLKHQ